MEKRTKLETTVFVISELAFVLGSVATGGAEASLRTAAPVVGVMPEEVRIKERSGTLVERMEPPRKTHVNSR